MKKIEKNIESEIVNYRLLDYNKITYCQYKITVKNTYSYKKYLSVHYII